MLLTVYDVDDLLLMGLRSSYVRVAAQLGSTFDLVTLGPVKYLLDIEVIVNRVQKSVGFLQRGYIDEILKRYRMESCKWSAPT